MTAASAPDSPGPTLSPTLRAWRRLPSGRAGSLLFSIGMCVRVPYFASILPRVTRMEPGRCEARAPHWWGVRNHLGTFHAIAACNLAEVTMGMLCEATVPSSHRWIPKSMSVDYLAKGRTSLRAVAELEAIPDFTHLRAGTDMVVPVHVYDKAGEEVVRARITTWVTPA
ncbi:hotdog fold domain-containing protein [Rhodococcus sp. HNM0569]|uniref:hotdog fold domain-containing protein n=1 Tax=Rhodococcus sp. HNM0569 TaxID=2716340 RepID=UPI00146B579F|nr:hotdog fold domain-containing protein [Rhodococcus sp. HNM0569]NLU81722.1 DUF4442 domain-containing protein [Rhodococcus sp. HNM0569]